VILFLLRCMSQQLALNGRHGLPHSSPLLRGLCCKTLIETNHER
jgi:hypothetical protein